jgi:hypothetical protein
LPEPTPGPEPEPEPEPIPDPVPGPEPQPLHAPRPGEEPERAAVLLRLAELPRAVRERRRSTTIAGGLARMSRPFTAERG